jgi:hypothetical protein
MLTAVTTVAGGRDLHVDWQAGLEQLRDEITNMALLLLGCC